jgi:hypothetical protein
MTQYLTGAGVRKYRCVAAAASGYVGGAQHVIAISPDRGAEGKIFAGGKEVFRTENGFRVLAAPGLAIGISREDAPEPGQRVDIADTPGETVLAEAGEEFPPESPLIADSEGRVIVARRGVRLSEPILSIAIEESAGSGSRVAVKIAPRGMRT